MKIKKILHLSFSFLFLSIFFSSNTAFSESILPDLIIPNALIIPEMPAETENFTIKVDVKNEGSATGNGFYVTARTGQNLGYLNQIYVHEILSSQTVKSVYLIFEELSQDEIDEIKVYGIQISVDSSITGEYNNQIPEVNEDNNTYTIPIPFSTNGKTLPPDSQENILIPAEKINTGFNYNMEIKVSGTSAIALWSFLNPNNEIFDGFALFLEESPVQDENFSLNSTPVLVSSNTNTYNFSDLKALTSYSLKIYTYTNISDSSQEFANESSASSFQTEESLSINNISAIAEQNSISVQWNLIEDPDFKYFALYKKENSNFLDSDFTITLTPLLIPSNINSYKFYDLDYSKTYYFKIYSADTLKDGTLQTLYPSPTASAATEEKPILFFDVNGHWAKDYIQKLLNLGIVAGYSDGSFKPNQAISRAELVKLALSADNIHPTDMEDEDKIFTDVIDWQINWVYKAKELGIVEGYSKNEFKPNLAVTRAEALKIIIETFNPSFPEKLSNTIFTDAANHWAENYIKIGIYLKLIEGYNDNTFRPNNPITRAEAVKIISLLMD